MATFEPKLLSGGRGVPLSGRLAAPGVYHPAISTALATAATLLGPFLIGLALRLPPFLAVHPLHRDEALYGSWARAIATGTDPFLIEAWVDKPPFVLYLLALAIRGLGPSTETLRLPGMIASLLAIPAVFGFAHNLYGRQAAVLAALLLAVSPFSVLFAPTAFTDPWLTLFVLLSAWAACSGRGLASGLLLGLAVACKQQGLLGVPLVAGLLFAGSRPSGRLRTWIGVLAGFLLILSLVTWWDSLRWATRPSFWDRSLDTYGGIHLIELHQVGTRLSAWARLAGQLFGVPHVSVALLGMAVLPVVRLSACRRPPALADAATAVLMAFIAAYFTLHVALSFQPWDRYLLPVLPLICVLAGAGLAIAWRQARSGLRRSMGALALAAALATSAWMGAGSRLPLGSDHGAYVGIDSVVAWARARPPGTAIYHRSLGWYFDFYLFGSPQLHPWVGTGWQLAEAASAARPREQWFVATDRDDVEALVLPLAVHGLALQREVRVLRPDGTPSFMVYRLAPAGTGGPP